MNNQGSNGNTYKCSSKLIIIQCYFSTLVSTRNCNWNNWILGNVSNVKSMLTGNIDVNLFPVRIDIMSYSIFEWYQYSQACCWPCPCHRWHGPNTPQVAQHLAHSSLISADQLQDRPIEPFPASRCPSCVHLTCGNQLELKSHTDSSEFNPKTNPVSLFLVTSPPWEIALPMNRRNFLLRAIEREIESDRAK